MLEGGDRLSTASIPSKLEVTHLGGALTNLNIYIGGGQSSYDSNGKKLKNTGMLKRRPNGIFKYFRVTIIRYNLLLLLLLLLFYLPKTRPSAS